MTGQKFTTSYKEYIVTKFLGKGKSGYSYIIEDEGKQFVLKKIHDEECPYYKFSDKMLMEIEAYEHLLKSDIKIPELIEYNYCGKYLIKQYIEGLTGTELIAGGFANELILHQLFSMHCNLKTRGSNIDYFPSNFVLENETLFYIDYEINPYLAEWDFEHWGIYYWLNTRGMKLFLETGDASHINESLDRGIPYKDEFRDRAEALIRHFSSDKL